MSEVIAPSDRWNSGIIAPNQVFNNNARRFDLETLPVLSGSTTAPPGSPDDGAIYIIPSGATGVWSGFSEDDLVIFFGGTWTAFAPIDGQRKYVDDVDENWQFKTGGGWSAEAGGGGGGGAPVVSESGASLTADDTNAGNYTRFTNASAKTYTFDDAETYTVGAEYHGRNVGAGDLTITEAGGMTINAPTGGTLVIPQGGTFTVKIVASDEADLIGVTVAV